MTALTKARAAIDTRLITRGIDAVLAEEDRAAADLRPALLAALKEALAAGRAAVRASLEEDGASGEEVVRANARLIDEALRRIFAFASDRVYPAANPTEAERIALLAVGGYGRGELAPYSDIDLLFLLPYKLTARTEQVVEYVLYLLWDLGLKVGHATRSIDECIRLAKSDITIRTAMLEARFLTGEKPLADELKKRFARQVMAGTGPEFVEAKLAERDARHKRMGDSRYVLEPNIKEGKGGLRDLQTLYWIGKYLYGVEEVPELTKKGVLTQAEADRFAKAENFLWTVRCHMHVLANRAEERLTFDMQPELARRLGYRDHAGTLGVERFMKHYYLVAKDVGNLTRIFCAALEAEHRRRPKIALPSLFMFKREADGFPIEAGRLTVKHGSEFAKEPVKMLRLFHAAQANELDIHPNALRWITRELRHIDRIRNNKEANRLFLEMLTSKKDPETTLRRLNEAGVFGRFVPDFGRVVAQMQHDMYHVFTVDEHTIFAIGILRGIEEGKFTESMPITSEAIHKIESRTALYFALMIHDIGKGRGGDHSVIGAGIANKLGPRLGLTPEETETASWLVRYHLIMSRTAFHRDLNDPKTIHDFVEVVQSLERLRLLLVLTVADIRAVGPTVWNAWKAALLRDLYYAAEEVLSGGFAAEGRERRVASAKAKLADALRAKGWDEPQIDKHLARGTPSYWLAYDTDAHLYQAEFLARADTSGDKLAIDTRRDSYRGVTEVTVTTADHPGLFSRIAGGIALARANIVEAKIFTLADGMALDTFLVQDANGEPITRRDQIERLTGRIERVLTGNMRVRPELERNKPPARTKVFAVAPRVLINNKASRTHTVIEVNGRDRPGLLFELTAALFEMGLQISSAMIFTYGERAVDVFYVKDVFGFQVTHEGKLDGIRNRLIEVLEGPDAEKADKAEKKAPARRARAR
jgi:[protein-PII] uridylyltransferase